MQKTILLIIVTVISIVSFAQSNYEKFKRLFKTNDTAETKLLLSDWEKSNPNDPEFYTSAFNFYFATSKQEIISLGKDQRKKESFQLIDSTGKTAGFIYSDLGYNSEKLNKAFGYIDKGIARFPNRLDMRFGKIYVLGEIKDYKVFTSEIIKTIEHSNTINNNWLWTENKKPDDDPQHFMLESVQTYLRQLYNTEEDSLLANMITIGDAVLKYYPNNIEILSTTAVAHIISKNYDKAILLLKQAEKLNPQDFIVLNNIAQGYKLKGDKENAIKYYELTAKYGDEQAKQQARENIEQLKK